MENYADDIDVDMSESFQPFLREWKSVQELAGLPVMDDDPTLIAKLERRTSVSIPDVDRTRLDLGNLKQKRAKSVGSDISTSDLGRRRLRSERSMETLWSSQSTFSINIDPECEQSGSSLNIGSCDVFLDAGGVSTDEQRERHDTLSNVENGDITESMETVTADTEDASRPDKTEDEVKLLMNDIIERISSTCKELSMCVYDPEDTEEEVERKLEVCKVCALSVNHALHLHQNWL